MQANTPETTTAAAVHEAGPVADWGAFRFEAPGLPAIAKYFLKERLGLTGMEVSLNSMPPGQGMPFVHRHRRNEELYLFLSGEGEFQSDGEVRPVRAGTCVRCAPAVGRAWRNTGREPLVFVCVQAPAGAYGPGKTVEDGELADEAVRWAAGLG